MELFSKIETSFYESKIRVNGKKIAKKSISVSEPDTKLVKIQFAFYNNRTTCGQLRIANYHCCFIVRYLQIREGDEIDVIKSFSPDNPENLVIARIEMLSARVDNEEEHIIIVARRFKSLTIENYPGADCYKSSDVDDAS